MIAYSGLVGEGLFEQTMALCRVGSGGAWQGEY
jgi:hypothetical protein